MPSRRILDLSERDGSLSIVLQRPAGKAALFRRFQSPKVADQRDLPSSWVSATRREEITIITVEIAAIVGSI